MKPQRRNLTELDESKRHIVAERAGLAGWQAGWCTYLPWRWVILLEPLYGNSQYVTLHPLLSRSLYFSISVSLSSLLLSPFMCPCVSSPCVPFTQVICFVSCGFHVKLFPSIVWHPCESYRVLFLGSRPSSGVTIGNMDQSKSRNFSTSSSGH